MKYDYLEDPMVGIPKQRKEKNKMKKTMKKSAKKTITTKATLAKPTASYTKRGEGTFCPREGWPPLCVWHGDRGCPLTTISKGKAPKGTRGGSQEPPFLFSALQAHSAGV